MTSAFMPLTTVLAAGRPADHVVAIHGGRRRSWTEFTSHVAGLARLLDGPRSTRWALCADDAWPFALVCVTVAGPEQRLQVSSPWIAEPGGQFTMGDRAEIASDGGFQLGPRTDRIVVPTGEGMAMLQRDGRRSLGTTLRRWLEPHWDRVLVPRVWRFVDRLPEDAQGKTSVTALQALFRSSVGP